MLLSFRGVKKQQKFEKLCGQLAGLDTGKHQIIVPDIAQSKYSVIDIMIDNESLNYITKVLHYNSLVWWICSGYYFIQSHTDIQETTLW